MLIGEHTIGDPPGVGDSYLTLTKTYTMDQYVVFTGVEPLEPGFRYSLNRNSGLYLMARITSAFDALVAIGKNDVSKSYWMSTSLLKSLASLSMDVILRPSYESTVASTSVIDALVWSYAEIFDEIWRQMETMSIALKLEYAQGSDLDDAWGQIYDLPRIVSESDTSYRDRLKTRTIILNSSGTKANCETIIDSIIGTSGVTLLTPRYPSSVDITFTTIDAMRIATEKLTTLNILIPQMLAYGVSYRMFLPYVDYLTDIVMKGPVTYPFNVFMALNLHNLEKTYTVINSIVAQYTAPYDIDITPMKELIKSVLMGSKISSAKSKTYIIDHLLYKRNLKTWSARSYIKQYNNTKTFIVDQYLLKYNNNKIYYIDELTKKSNKRRYSLGMKLVTA